MAKRKLGNRVAENDQRRRPGVEARAVLDRLAHAERNRDRVGDERHPQPERHRDRQLLLDQLDDRRVAVIALAEIEGRIVAHQHPEALRRRLVEAVLLLQLLDEFRIEPLRAAIARGNVAARVGHRAGADLAAAAAEVRGRALVVALQLRDRALDRPARHELHDGEGDQHDAEDGRDHQEKAAGDIGEHGSSAGEWRMANGEWRRMSSNGAAATRHSLLAIRHSPFAHSPIFFAFSSSHHQVSGAPTPSFGWRSGRENASQ